MKKLLVLLVAVASLTLSAADFIVGSCNHYFWDELPIEESMRMMNQWGLTSYRTESSWWRAELPDGTWRLYPYLLKALEASKKFNIEPLILLCGTSKKIGGNFPYGEYIPPFLEYVDETTKLLNGKTRLIQVWNEWDGGHMMGAGRGKVNTSKNYVELLKQVYPIVKRNCPDAIVMSNSFSTGEKALYEAFAEGMQDYCDAYSIHCYDWNWGIPENMYPGLVRREEMSAKYHNGKPLPFYITEFGWLTGEKTTTEQNQADYIARFLLLARTIKTCKGVYVYNFQERAEDWTNMENYWGTLVRDLTPKPSIYAYSSVAKLVTKAEFVRRIDVGNPDVWILLFKKDDGSQSLAAWTIKTDVRQQIILNKKGSPCGTIQFERCGAPAFDRTWGFLDQCSGFTKGPNVFKPFNPEQFSFHVTTCPVLIHNLPETFEVESTREVYTPQPKNFTPVIPAAFEKIAPEGTSFVIEGYEAWRQLHPNQMYRGDAKDLSSKATVRFDAEKLYFDFEVTDDVFVGPKTDSVRNWEHDSVQLSFAPFVKGRPYEPKYTDYMLAFANGKPSLYYRSHKNQSFSNVGSSAIFKFTKKADNVFVYSFSVPFSEIGADYTALSSGTCPLGFTYIVNDDDGKGRKGYLFWGEAIGGARVMTNYGWLFLGRLKDAKGIEIGFPTFHKKWNWWVDKIGGTFCEDEHNGLPYAKMKAVIEDNKPGFVAIRRDLPHPISNFKEMRVALFSKQMKEFVVRYVDGTNQYFQYRYAINSSDDMQIVSCRFDNHHYNKDKSNLNIWGGAKDKVWHDPLKRIEILLDIAPWQLYNRNAKEAEWYLGSIRIFTNDEK